MNVGYKTKYWWTSWISYWLLKIVSGIETLEALQIEQPMTSSINRQIRELSFPEESEMGLFFALAVPLDDPVSTKAISVAFFFEANYQLSKPETEDETEMEENRNKESRRKRSMRPKKRPIDRRTIYSMVESKFESLGFPGRSCLLRSICETVHNPPHMHNGLIGDLFRIIFTPSSSIDEGLSDEYTNAENQVNTSDGCGVTYSLCPFGIYDYITVKYK